MGCHGLLIPHSILFDLSKILDLGAGPPSYTNRLTRDIHSWTKDNRPRPHALSLSIALLSGPKTRRNEPHTESTHYRHHVVILRGIYLGGWLVSSRLDGKGPSDCRQRRGYHPSKCQQAAVAPLYRRKTSWNLAPRLFCLLI